MLACKTRQLASRNWLERRMQRTDVDVLYISALTVHTCWGRSNLPSYIFTHESLGGLFFHSTKRQLREWYHCSSCSNVKNSWWWQRDADMIRFPPDVRKIFNKPHKHKDETDYASLPSEKSHVKKPQSSLPSDWRAVSAEMQQFVRHEFMSTYINGRCCLLWHCLEEREFYNNRLCTGKWMCIWSSAPQQTLLALLKLWM